MKSFVHFFLEYRHNLADGTPAPSIQAHNGKNPNRVNPEKKYLFTKGDYQKENDKLDIPGAILTFPELEQMGLKNLMSEQLPKTYTNIRNSGANVHVYKQGNMIMGKVIKHSNPDK